MQVFLQGKKSTILIFEIYILNLFIISGVDFFGKRG